MAGIEPTVRRIVSAESWDRRIQEIRRIPESHGTAEQKKVYAAVAEKLYKPHLSANFSFVPRRAEYELDHFRTAYRQAADGTAEFTEVDPSRLSTLLQASPTALLVFRTIVGYTPKELAVATREVAAESGEGGVTDSRIKSMERGGSIPEQAADTLAVTIHRLVERRLWGHAPEGLRSKMDKTDTADGWTSVRNFARSGVPYEAFLHQRHMGGAFRQLLDAASEERGAMLELTVEHLFEERGIPYLRTGSTDQGEIVHRFNLTVTPAPDFVVFDPPDDLRALLECKLTNDGGTARDKASRFMTLQQEGQRLGGVPVFALLDGLGWERVNDALGPVVEACDGRVFTLETVSELVEVRPFPELVGKQE